MKLNSRNEKITFLKYLQTGKADIKELLPPKMETWLHDGNKYQKLPTGEILSEDEYNMKLQNERFKKIGIIKAYPKKVIFIERC